MIDAASAPSSRVRIEACSAAIVDVGLTTASVSIGSG